MLAILQSSFEWVLSEIFPKLQFFLHFLIIAPSPSSPGFRNCISHINQLLHTQDETSNAVNLLKATDWDFTAADEKYLGLLLTHHCDWSATYSNHMDDSWIRFNNWRDKVEQTLKLIHQEEACRFIRGLFKHDAASGLQSMPRNWLRTTPFLIGSLLPYYIP